MRKDIIIFVNAIRPATFEALDLHERETGRKFTPVVLVDEKIAESIYERNVQYKITETVTRIVADFDSPSSIRQAISPYTDRIYAVTSQYENSIHELKKLIPYFPDLPMPTEKSLEWATEKKLMRELLESYDTSLVPAYREISDSSLATVDAIESSMSYPLIVKPSGLEGSLLVTRVDNRRELQVTLRRTLREMQKAYDKWVKRQTPTLLVEEFMEGDMYSVDTYVSGDGGCYHTPVVKVVTGHKVGFDDFFGYMQTAPAGLSSEEIQAAHYAAERACNALALRAVTAHVELMKTAHGWKIIELGPRIGGFRHDIYLSAYGVNHIMNDIINRAGERPDIYDDAKACTAFFNIYAREEGAVESLQGVNKIKRLSSFVRLTQNIRIGEDARFAKNNGDPVLVVMLSHESEEQLQADINELERVIKIRVTPLLPPTPRRRLTDKYLKGSFGEPLAPHRPYFSR